MEKKYQLRRMLLINAGTNKHLPSNRITSIDPRGGALVTGPNGVGKTMTLRLLPLFFGFLPSRLAADGDVQKGMVRFILPEETSAIAFEYQRGDSQELRLAVMRRDRADVNAPFYRIFRSAWDQNLFVRDGIFLTDEEATSGADVQYTKKLTSAEYRAVILRSALVSKDKTMRALQMEHSFGPSPLENLDRLVATMLQDKVSFSDIIQVAVSRAQQNIGAHTEHGRLAFKQKRSQIDDWVSRRRAGANALEKVSDVVALRDSMDRVISFENKIRTIWWDAHALKKFRDDARTSTADELQQFVKQWEIAVEQELGVRQTLAGAVSDVHGRYVSECKLRDELQGQWAYFGLEDAEGWKQKLTSFATLQSELQGLRAQIEASTLQHGAAVAQYDRLKEDARSRAEADVKELEGAKKAPASAMERDCARIDEEFESTTRGLHTEHEAIMAELLEQKSLLHEQIGEWKQRLKEPQPSQQAQDSLRAANAALHAHQDRQFKAVQKNGRLGKEVEAARQAFDRQEGEVRRARTRLESCQDVLAQATEQLNPPEGTLLHALRTHPDQGWRHHLAKVIDADRLLMRTDLSPRWLEEGGSLYGWGLGTEEIDSPTWVDDDRVRAAIAEHQQAIGAAGAHLEAVQGELARLSAVLEQATVAFSTDSAELEVMQSQSEELLSVVGLAEQEIDSQKISMASVAGSKVSDLSKSLSDLELQISAKANGWVAQEAKLIAERNALKAAVTARCEAALRAIEEVIENARSQVIVRCKEIDVQMNEHLSANGVDVGRLTAQQQEAGRLAGRIQDLERHRPMVAGWDVFTSNGGETRLATSKTKAHELGESLNRLQGQLSQHNTQWAQRTEVAGKDRTALMETIAGLERDSDSLQSLMLEIGSRPALIASAISPRHSVEELRGRFREESAALQNAQSAMQSKFTNLRNDLFYGERQLGKFVQDWMSQRVSPDASLATQAQELCSCHARIGLEFVRANNVELRTILANIGSLHATIANFESEVKRVNTRLQEGLSQVKCFERIQDLKLDIEPNFEDLGFYKKLSQMSSAIRAYNDARHTIDDHAPAPQKIVSALSDFASVLGSDGNLEVNLGQHITLSGSVVDNGKLKQFKREKELISISSNGLSSILRITLVMALINTMRGADPVYVPWVTDEIATFDGPNLIALMQMLAENKIDVVTAAPDLDPLLHPQFSQRYIFQDRGRVRVLADRSRPSSPLGTHLNPAEQQGALS